MRTSSTPAQSEVERLLDEYATLTEALNITRRRRQELRTRIVEHMARERVDELYDGEHGVTARLQTRHGAPGYDLASMPDDLVLRLRDLVVLSVDAKAMKALDGAAIEALEMTRFEVPGPETVALIVHRDGGAS